MITSKGEAITSRAYSLGPPPLCQKLLGAQRDACLIPRVLATSWGRAPVVRTQSTLVGPKHVLHMKILADLR